MEQSQLRKAVDQLDDVDLYTKLVLVYFENFNNPIVRGKHVIPTIGQFLYKLRELQAIHLNILPVKQGEFDGNDHSSMVDYV